jgi:hypothetical protein
MCLTLLEALGEVFQRCGGPWPHAKIIKESLQVRQCWHLARFQLAEVVESLEIGKMYGEVWEKQHPEDAGTIWTTSSSTLAMRKAEMETRYPALISNAPAPAAPMLKRELDSFVEARVKIAKERKKKHVTFTIDTINWPVRHRAEFNRDPKNKAYYDPPNGRHPAPLGVE